MTPSMTTDRQLLAFFNVLTTPPRVSAEEIILYNIYIINGDVYVIYFI